MPKRAGKRKNTIPAAKKEVIVKQIKINEMQEQPSSPKRTSNMKITNNLQYDTNKKLSNEIEGEKYLVGHRTDIGLTMKDMSPIMLETAFKTVTNNGKIRAEH
ncbi:hypothetical protein ACKWTF_002432 [Chironomus riparius]